MVESQLQLQSQLAVVQFHISEKIFNGADFAANREVPNNQSHKKGRTECHTRLSVFLSSEKGEYIGNIQLIGLIGRHNFNNNISDSRVMVEALNFRSLIATCCEWEISEHNRNKNYLFTIETTIELTPQHAFQPPSDHFREFF